MKSTKPLYLLVFQSKMTKAIETLSTNLREPPMFSVFTNE